MRADAVPQDQAATYGGHHKLMYAVDERGDYTGVTSSGWQVEAEATLAAVAELERLRDDAWARARAGLTAPLEYHMYRQRMEPATLATTTGLWRWRIRRHLRPARFARLSIRLLRRYAEALGLPIEQLRTLPDRPEA
jgi:hypothetical protein